MTTLTTPIYHTPPRSDWDQLCQRVTIAQASLDDQVRPILQAVRQEGDAALVRFSQQFDQAPQDFNFVVSAETLAQAQHHIAPALRQAIDQALANIRTFHQSQLSETKPVEIAQGLSCWRKAVAIDKVGFYIPGGTAPLFSTVLMLGVPAQIAGCQEIVLCTPPDKQGNIHPAILYAAHQVGIRQVFKVGGAQAIAAMGYGTQTVPKVYKIFGPGNQYVTAAKMLLAQEGIAIDMPAGPSELLVIADQTANPAFIAADLLSQAEHGIDSQVVLLTTSSSLAEQVLQALQSQLSTLPRQAIAEKALANSRLVVLASLTECMEFSNLYAPEHLIIATADPLPLAEKVRNAGSVFLGHYAPESAGDYASGTNHVLPTNAYAKAFSGVSLDSFYKKITFQQLSREGLQHIAQAVETMASAENLEAHRRAVSIRLQSVS
ncbi:MAG TPA: histidinol dehydrogenase [Microscillaceae bacterium]|nr:histidinol dehydrogenase [Microscillaceae bacterium]